MTLRRARGIERTGDLKVLALVAKCADLFRIEKASGCLILRKRIVGPGVPETFDNVGKFVRALIACIAGNVFAVAEVQRIIGVGRRDQVPAGAAAADVVERGETPGDVKRLVVCRGGGGDKPDAKKSEESEE